MSMLTTMCFTVGGIVAALCIVYFIVLWKIAREPRVCQVCGGRIVETNEKLHCEFCGEEYL